MEFHQLGGFQAGIYSFPKGPLGQKIYEPLQLKQNRGDGSLELVLGVKRSGTSHLLLTKDEKDFVKQYVTRLEKVDWTNFGRRKFSTDEDRDNARDAVNRTHVQWRDRALSSDGFESLSPILFRNLSELEATIDGLVPKPGQNRDTSSLNKSYVDNGPHGVERARFENSRVFYRVLQKEMNPNKFDHGDSSWRPTIRVFSFCYNVWATDNRALQERRRAPRVLDVGWCEAPIPALGGDMTMSQHIVVKNNQLLQKSTMARYEYSDIGGETETLDAQAVAAKVRDFFGKHTEPTRNPVVLLVHNKDSAMDMFKSFGVDISKWEFDLKKLLRPERIAPPRQAPNDPRRRPGASRGRSRSASPRPHDRTRRDSPPRRSYAPVYVVDIQAMFVAVLGTAHNSESVPAICKRLDLFDKKGWCAGNESWMLVNVFRSMAQGGTVLDQKQEWPDIRAPTVVSPAKAVPGTGDDEESEYEGSDSD